MKRLSLFHTLSLVSLLGTLALSGCSANFGNITPVSTQVPVGVIKGSVFGGQGPIVGAEVFLFKTATNGYGAASTSVLTTGLHDGGVGGDYVLTDTSGAFNITGDYTCTAGDNSVEYYLYSIGGMTNYSAGSGTTNVQAGLVSALGLCPASGTFATKYNYVYMNEVSTVAMMFAVQGYATSAISIGIGPENGASTASALAAQGLQNAFINASQIYDIAGSQPLHRANTVTPGGTGTVPQVLVDTLADILAACVNSATGSSPCYNLFTNATQTGATGTTGEAKDTAQAALFIAQHPFANVAYLLGLDGTGGMPFAPNITYIPNDFTIGINYVVAGMTEPNEILIDGSDNVWITNMTATGNTMTELTNQGAFTTALAEVNTNYATFGLSGNLFTSSLTAHGVNYFVYKDTPAGAVTHTTTQLKGTAFLHPSGLAADNIGVYVADPYVGDSGYVEVTSAGAGSAIVDYTFPGATFIAPDGNFGLWMTAPGTGQICFVYELGAASPTSQPCKSVSSALATPERIAISQSGFAWIPSNSSNTLSKLVLSNFSGGIAVNFTTPAASGGLTGPFGVAVDGANTIWVANTGNNSISAFSASGAAKTPSTGMNPSFPCAGSGAGSTNCTNNQSHYNLAIDNSGDIWLANTDASSYASVTEIIGAAAPTITPIATAIGSGYQGNLP